MQPHPERGVWGSNLAALSAKDPALAARIAASGSSPAVSFRESRTGKQIPCLAAEGGPLPLHSLYDPDKEGRRLAETVSGPGFLVCLGIGGAYHALPLLSNPDLSGLVLLDRDAGMLRAVLERIDMRPLFSDARVSFLIDAAPRSIAEAILSLWIPGLCGSLRTLPLRSRVERDLRYFRAAGDALRSAVDGAAADYSVQSVFGRRWFCNIARNLPAAAAAPALPRLAKEAYVVGAGPSLESQIPVLRSRARSVPLLSADTAFPALVSAGLVPDLVVSIDCQHYSTFHFLKGFPETSILALDLSSPPPLARAARRLAFFAGGHPFSRFAARRGFPLLPVDTSGGNVSHAAVSLAIALGAEEVRLFGVDFSYPDGKAYARGTYQYDYILRQSGRLFPVSQGFARLVFGRGGLVRDAADGFPRYTTPQLSAYKEKMEDSFRALPARITQAPGRGLRLALSSGTASAVLDAPSGAVPDAPSGAVPDALVFLRSYLELLGSLPMPPAAGMAGFASLPSEARDAWMTLLPLVPWERTRDAMETRPSVLLHRVRSTASAIVLRVLGEHDGRVAHE